MTAVDTLTLAAEARAKGLWLRYRTLDVWFTPYEIERAIINGENWAASMPLELADRAEAGAWASDPVARIKTKAPDDEWFECFIADIFGGVIVLCLVGLWARYLLGRSGEAMFDRVLLGLLG